PAQFTAAHSLWIDDRAGGARHAVSGGELERTTAADVVSGALRGALAERHVLLFLDGLWAALAAATWRYRAGFDLARAPPLLRIVALGPRVAGLRGLDVLLVDRRADDPLFPRRRVCG